MLTANLTRGFKSSVQVVDHIYRFDSVTLVRYVIECMLWSCARVQEYCLILKQRRYIEISHLENDHEYFLYYICICKSKWLKHIPALKQCLRERCRFVHYAFE